MGMLKAIPAHLYSKLWFSPENQKCNRNTKCICT